ncbi:MAG: acid phosphatase, partial [Burkholderiales bacterium 21-58-4]
MDKDANGQNLDGPQDPARRRLLGCITVVGVGLALGGGETTQAAAAKADARLDQALRSQVRNIVVIYAENRSFNNLYSNFPGVQSPLSGVPASRSTQLDRDGHTPLARLPKIWGGLVPRPQDVDGKHFEITQDQIEDLSNGPFHLADAQGAPLPLGVITRDLWHRFYQNQMQINAGRNNQFV